MRRWQKTCQYEYTLTELRIGLHEKNGLLQWWKIIHQKLWEDANIAVQKTGKETEAGLNSIIKITTKDPQKMKWCQ